MLWSGIIQQKQLEMYRILLISVTVTTVQPRFWKVCQRAGLSNSRESVLRTEHHIWELWKQDWKYVIFGAHTNLKKTFFASNFMHTHLWASTTLVLSAVGNLKYCYGQGSNIICSMLNYMKISPSVLETAINKAMRICQDDHLDYKTT